jgi:hypothetical protein
MQRIPSSVDDPVMPTTLQATAWETFLVRTDVVELLTIVLIAFFII